MAFDERVDLDFMVDAVDGFRVPFLANNDFLMSKVITVDSREHLTC